MYVGCYEIKDVGNGQRKNSISWASIHKIERRLAQGTLESAGGWSGVMHGSYQVNGRSDQRRS